MEDGVPARASQGGRESAPARLGGARKPHRRRLEGCGADARFRQSGGAQAAAIFGGIRGPARNSSLGFFPVRAPKGRCQTSRGPPRSGRSRKPRCPGAKSMSRSLRAAPPAAAPAAAAWPTRRFAARHDESVSSPARTAEAEEAATQVLYRFPSKVTLASGATMMMPFVDHEIGASRAYLYQPETNALPAARRCQAEQ